MSSTRSAWRIYLKDGVMADGRIVARKVTSYADSGAYSRQTPYALTKHAANAAGPYAIPNVSIDAYCVYTNRQPTSAMRGFGDHDGVVRARGADGQDRRAVGLDPWTIRFRNAYRERRHEAAPQAGRGRHADRDDAGGGRARRPRARPELQAMTSAPRERSATDGGRPMTKLRGTGHRRGQLPDRDEPRRRPVAGARPCHDQRLVRRHARRRRTSARGCKTVIGQIAAETLGVAFEEIVVDTADTDTGPH